MNRAHFEEQLLPIFDALLGYAVRMSGDRAEGEDLLQEGVYRAFRGFDGFQAGTNFKAWMFRIVTNAFLSRRRSARRAPEPLPGDVPAAQDEAATAELEDARTDWARVYREQVDDDVRRAIDALPEEFRGPLLLSSLGGLRYQEIADTLEIPVGTVMSRLFRARERLRRALRDYARARGIAVAEAAPGGAANAPPEGPGGGGCAGEAHPGTTRSEVRQSPRERAQRATEGDGGRA